MNEFKIGGAVVLKTNNFAFVCESLGLNQRRYTPIPQPLL